MIDKLEVRNKHDNEWYRIWKEMSKKELRKWSATGPNDSILCPPLEKLHSLRTADIQVFVAVEIENEYFGYYINKMAKITTTYMNNN